MDGLKVFSGSSHPTLAQDVCKCLGITPGAITTKRFSNENLKVRIEENVREQDVFVVQTAAPPLSEHIVELLILLDALTHASARRVTAVLPYFPYARSDKKDEPRISVTARLMADLLVTAGADRVLTVDLHSPQIQGFFSIPADQLTAVPVLCERLRGEGVENMVVVAADVGETKDAGRFARRLDLPIAVVDKRRVGDDERAEAVAVIGDVAGKRCLLVDDEIATGGTLFSATDFLLSKGARSVSAAVIHPVLSGGAMDRLAASRLDRLLVTDTIPLRSASTKIEVLSVAPLLAEAITRIHDGRSVSALF
ncbi:MAG TPA: ribose-phosphate pyrophosphokinase [Candidatus Methylomirabilis sp.]|nr:ribose-phosphate pyrophosphokinase [Candidatus Methylomirabilis sp.]